MTVNTRPLLAVSTRAATSQPSRPSLRHLSDSNDLMGAAPCPTLTHVCPLGGLVRQTTE